MRHAAALALTVLFVLACSGPQSEIEPAEEPRVEAPRRPWPQTFVTPAVLVAREVSIEGPPGLLEHFALRPDQRAHDYVVRTVPEGLLQEVTLRADVPPEPIRGYLDQLEVAAEVRLRVLERAVDCELVVRASGDAFFQRPGQPEQRGESLRLDESSPR
jgi:hypothetical protein